MPISRKGDNKNSQMYGDFIMHITAANDGNYDLLRKKIDQNFKLKNDEIVNLRAEMQKLKNKSCASCLSKNKIISSKNKEIDQKKTSINNLQNQIGQKQQLIEKLQNEKRAEKENKEEVERMLRNMEQSNDQLSNEYDILLAENEKLKNNWSCWKRTNKTAPVEMSGGDTENGNVEQKKKCDRNLLNKLIHFVVIVFSIFLIGFMIWAFFETQNFIHEYEIALWFEGIIPNPQFEKPDFPESYHKIFIELNYLIWTPLCIGLLVFILSFFGLCSRAGKFYFCSAFLFISTKIGYLVSLHYIPEEINDSIEKKFYEYYQPENNFTNEFAFDKVFVDQIQIYFQCCGWKEGIYFFNGTTQSCHCPAYADGCVYDDVLGYYWEKSCFDSTFQKIFVTFLGFF